MSIKREEKALREFKRILEDLVVLLRVATGAKTVYMHWVNRARQQFVLEAKSTSLSNVMFKDRVEFQDHFLENYRDNEEIVLLRVHDNINPEDLNHYYENPLVNYVTLVPFVNNGETVALTAIESEKPFLIADHEQAVQSFRSALGNVLNTYLELTDLFDKQQEWIEYEESLNLFSTQQHKVEILHRMLSEMQKILPGGGASFIARGMETWVNVLNSPGAKIHPALGMMIDEKSIAYASLKSGKPEFAMHFNQNPKRISSGEAETEGATLAIPLMIDDRRHGTVIASDKNPLVFKESVKHKLTNLVRTAGLAIRANLGKISVDEDLLTSEYSSFIPDLWEKAIETEITNVKSTINTWFGFITIENLQVLRSKHRLEELRRLQRTLTKSMNPSLFGYNGYIGFNSDYVFTFMIQDQSGSAVAEWLDHIQQMLKKPVVLSDGQEVDVEVTTSFIPIDGHITEVHSVVQSAKSKLAEAVKETVSKKSFFDFRR
jgi:hypothetical protein